MFTIIGLMLTGMLLGYLLRKRSLHKIHTVITVLIWALLFILGIAAWALWKALYRKKGKTA